MRAWLCAAVLVGACGGGLGSGDDDGTPDGGGSGSGDAQIPPGWSMLIERNWSLPPSVEDFRCKRIKIEEDMFVSGFRVLSPPGTHHEILTISTTSTQLGDYDCGPSNNEPQMLFAGGIDTNDMLFPEGVAIKLPKDTYINLNLHLFNASDDPLNGQSGVLVKTVPANEVVHEADMMFLGTSEIMIPSSGQPVDILGSCTFPTDWHVFGLWPHMHGYATHQKVWVKRSNQTTEMLLDESYSYVDQKAYPMTDTLVRANEELWVSCTYVNTSGQPVTYGESATQEMCLTGMYKYPKGGTLYSCANP